MAISPELRDRIKRDYPAWAPLLDIPEIANLLGRAATEGWDTGTLQSNLYATTWWKTRTEAQRNAEILQRTDPKQYAAQRANIINQMTQEARRLGLTLTHAEMLWVGTRATNEGWDANQITQSLVAVGRRHSLQAGGSIAAASTEIGTLMQRYGVKVSEGWRQEQARQIAMGAQTIDGVRNYFHNRMYAWARSKGNEMLKEALANGLTTWEAVQPMLSVLAEELEVPIDSFDLSNGLGSKILNYKDADTGQIRMATDTEALQMARSDRRWRDTGGARNLAAETTAAISEFMGVRA